MMMGVSRLEDEGEDIVTMDDLFVVRRRNGLGR